MRSFIFSDVFKVIRILKKAGIADQAQAVFSNLKNNATQKEVGTKFLFMCLENLGTVEDEIAEFFGSLKEVDPSEIKKMELDEMAALFKEFAEHEGIKRFLSSLSAWMK